MLNFSYLYISPIGIEIIVGLFAHGERENHYKWTHVCDKETDLEYLDELSERGNKEEEIEKKFELMKENLRYEGD